MHPMRHPIGDMWNHTRLFGLGSGFSHRQYAGSPAGGERRKEAIKSGLHRRCVTYTHLPSLAFLMVIGHPCVSHLMLCAIWQNVKGPQVHLVMLPLRVSPSTKGDINCVLKKTTRLQELGIPMVTSSVRTIEKIQRQDQQNNDEDAEYSPPEKETLQAEFVSVPLGHQRSTM